jgi:lipoprotein NlpD
MPAEPRPPAPRPGAWQWPAAGKLIQRFSAGAQPHKGVDIDGRSGDPVYAANSGSVVYAGNGVRGYGNLLIVKHDETFLSAYAHNSKLLVKEGDVVRGGEKIAEIGDSGTDRVKLHFEVRKQGNPVDPLKILPGR